MNSKISVIMINFLRNRGKEGIWGQVAQSRLWAEYLRASDLLRNGFQSESGGRTTGKGRKPSKGASWGKGVTSAWYLRETLGRTLPLRVCADSRHGHWAFLLQYQPVTGQTAEWKENVSPWAWPSLGICGKHLQSWATLQRECRHRPIGTENTEARKDGGSWAEQQCWVQRQIGAAGGGGPGVALGLTNPQKYQRSYP